MQFRITVEVRLEGDPFPDIDTVEVEYGSLEEAWRLSKAVAAAQQVDHPRCEIKVVAIELAAIHAFH